LNEKSPIFSSTPYQGTEWEGLVQLQSKTSAERRKMTVFQGILQSEGTPEARGLQQNQSLPLGAARSHNPVN